jgi:enoyl-CoA hydratase/carnithine racemase
MGLSKSNELLLLGKKIDANTALQWNICSRVVKSEVLDPFHTDSLANYMATEVDTSLLQLPLGSKTARIFVDLVRRNRKDRLKEICRKELEHLDTRFNNGDVLAAIMNLKDFKNNNGHRSKL